MKTTSELFSSINDMICLSPSAKYYLKAYLRELDGEQIINDFKEDEDNDN